MSRRILSSTCTAILAFATVVSGPTFAQSALQSAPRSTPPAPEPAPGSEAWLRARGEAYSIATDNNRDAVADQADSEAESRQAGQDVFRPGNAARAETDRLQREADKALAELAATQALNDQIAARNAAADQTDAEAQARHAEQQAFWQADAARAETARVQWEADKAAADAAEAKWERDQAAWRAEVEACRRAGRSPCTPQ